LMSRKTVIDIRRPLRCSELMSLQRFGLVLAFTCALAAQSPTTAVGQSNKGNYRAKLISPKPGEVVVPGQVVRIAWTADFPQVDLTMCETEVLLSLDGGKTVYMLLRELRDPKVQYIDWTVPNAPSNQAVLDIRFGCLNLYPESSSLQSTFVIAPAAK